MPNTAAVRDKGTNQMTKLTDISISRRALLAAGATAVDVLTLARVVAPS